MKMTESIRRVSAITIAAALGMLTLIPADAASEEVAVMRHTTKPLPGYGTLTLEIWNDGTDVQVRSTRRRAGKSNCSTSSPKVG